MIQLHINIHPFFFEFFPIQVIAEYWVEYPVLYSRSLLIIPTLLSALEEIKHHFTMIFPSTLLRYDWNKKLDIFKAYNVVLWCIYTLYGLPRWHSGKEFACQCKKSKRHTSSIPRSGRSPGEGNGNLLQYSWLENSLDRGACRATVYGVTKSRTWLIDWAHTHTLCNDYCSQAN